MKNELPLYVYLPGAGNRGEGELAALAKGLQDEVRFELIPYPGWSRYVEDGYSAEVQIEELTAQIEAKVPAGPIRIMGLSIGGHFGYAVALKLQAKGREVAAFCALDSFMISTPKPKAGWQRRAVNDGLELLRRRGLGGVATFVRSRLWRLLIRLAGGRLIRPLQKLKTNRTFAAMLRMEPIGESELNFLLLVGAVAPWLAQLDDNPAVMTAPTTLLRTSSNTSDDLAWKKRCPRITAIDIPGGHHSLFEAENVPALRSAFLKTAVSESGSSPTT